MGNYNSPYTGEQIDELLGLVDDNHIDWSGKADAADVAALATTVQGVQSGLNGKADLESIAGAQRLRFSQVPLCFLSNTEEADSYTGTGNNQIWYCTDGNLYYHVNDADYPIGTPQYILYYSHNAIYKWNGRNNGGFKKIIDGDYFDSSGRLKMSALPENLPTGGMDEEIYFWIKANMETLRSRFNTLISLLANLAFTNGKPNSGLTIPDEFYFPDQTTPDPDTPSGDTYSIIVEKYDNGSWVSAGSTLGLGTFTGEQKSVKLRVRCNNSLESSISLAVAAAAGFSVSPSTLTAYAVNNNAAEFYVYFGGQNLAEGSYGGYLLIRGDEINSVSIGLTATVPSQGGGDPVNPEGDTTLPVIKREYHISGVDGSGNIETAASTAQTKLSCTSQWYKMPTSWDSAEINTGCSGGDRLNTYILCKFINNDNNEIGISPYNQGNIANTNHKWYSETSQSSGKIAFQRVVDAIGTSAGYTANTNGYTITHIAFTVLNTRLVSGQKEQAYLKVTTGGTTSYLMEGYDTSTWTEDNG